MNRFDTRYKKALSELRNEIPVGFAIRSRLRLTKTSFAVAGCATLIAASLIFTSLPTKASAVTLTDVLQAIHNARIRHTQTYQVGPPNDGEVTTESWEANGKLRLSFSQFWIITDGVKRWTFSRGDKSLKVTSGRGDILDSADTLLDLEKLIKVKSSGESVSLSQSVEDGKPVLMLKYRSWFETDSNSKNRKRYPLETVWIADPDDKLPRKVKHFQAVHSDDGRKIRLRQTAYSKIDYPSTCPAGTFDTDLPKRLEN